MRVARRRSTCVRRSTVASGAAMRVIIEASRMVCMYVVKRWLLGRTVQRRIAGLAAEADHEEIARLTLQVLYGDPIVVHARYLVGFARQMAVPSTLGWSIAITDEQK